MQPPAETPPSSPIQAVRQACDRIKAVTDKLPPEQRQVALQREVARHVAERFPDIDPAYVLHAFGIGVLDMLRCSPEHAQPAVPS